MLKDIIHAFLNGLSGHVSRWECISAEKRMRAHLSEREIDKMIMDSFPASDPPSTY